MTKRRKFKLKRLLTGKSSVSTTEETPETIEKRPSVESLGSLIYSNDAIMAPNQTTMTDSPVDSHVFSQSTGLSEVPEKSLATTESELQAKILRMLEPGDDDGLGTEEDEETLDRSSSKKLGRSDTVTTEVLFTSLRSNLSTYSSQSELRLRQAALEEEDEEDSEQLDTVPSLSLALHRARSNKRRINRLSVAMSSIDNLLVECQDFVEDLLDEENGIKKSYARSPSLTQSTSVLTSSYASDTKEVGSVSNEFSSDRWRSSLDFERNITSPGTLFSRLQNVVTSHLTSPVLKSADVAPMEDNSVVRASVENTDFYDLDDILASDECATGSPLSTRSATVSLSLAETGGGSTLFSNSRQNSFSSFGSTNSAGQENKSLDELSPPTPRERTISDKTLPETPNRSSVETTRSEPLNTDHTVRLDKAATLLDRSNSMKTPDRILPAATIQVAPLVLQEVPKPSEMFDADKKPENAYDVSDGTFRDMDPSRLSIMDDSLRQFVFTVPKDDRLAKHSMLDESTDKNTKANAKAVPLSDIPSVPVTPPPRNDSITAIVHIPETDVPEPSISRSASVRKILVREVSNEDLRLVTLSTSDTSSIRSQVPELAQLSPVIVDNASDHSNDSVKSVKKNVSFVEAPVVSPDRKLNRATAIVPGFILKWKKSRSSPTRKVKQTKSILKTPEPPILSFDTKEAEDNPVATYVDVPSSKLSLGSDFGIPPPAESSANPSLITITDESFEIMNRSISAASEDTVIQRSFEEPIGNLSKEGSNTLNRTSQKKQLWLAFPSLSLSRSDKKGNDKETQKLSNESRVKSIFNLKRRPSLIHRNVTRECGDCPKRNSEDITRSNDQEWQVDQVDDWIQSPSVFHKETERDASTNS